MPHCAHAHHSVPDATHGATVKTAVPSRVSPPDPGAARHSTPARDHAAARAQQQCAEQLPAQSLTYPQTVASTRSVPPHLCPCSLRIRRCRCPRQPWCACVARWAGSPRREPHRAAPTEAPSSRTERAHSRALHGPPCTHACQASSHMPILSSTQHPPGAPRGSRCHIVHVLIRVCPLRHTVPA